MDSDEALLQAWRDGDRHMGDQLVQKHFPALHRFFRVRVGDDVDDLIQRTFLDCVTRRESIRAGGFRAYLFRVARNRLVDHIRQTSRQPDFDPHTSVVPDRCTTPSLAIARHQEVRLIRQALRRLALDHQIALGLYYWDGLTTPEMADALEIPANTVRSRLSRARDRLREAVEAIAESPELCSSTLDGLETWAGKLGALARDETRVQG